MSEVGSGRAALQDALGGGHGVLVTKFVERRAYLHRWGIDKRRPEWGFGRVESRVDEGVILRYFDVPGRLEHRESVPFGQIEVPNFLPAGTDVWRSVSDFGWIAGRIEGMTGRQYRVRLSGDTRSYSMAYDDLLLRWSRGLEDPIAALQGGLVEHPGYYRARRPMVDELLRSWRLARGYHGALSAPIRLYKHQVDVLARVLADPWMRYLLADEVGLGKTIEAGLIIRQLLHDDPHLRFVVAAPRPLVDQWMDELSTRLMLRHHVRSGIIRVIPHEELRTVRLVDAPYLILDEVHKIAGLVTDDPSVRLLVENVKGLLALSATPMKGDPGVLRRVFSAVDASAYGDTSDAEFAARLQQRERDAREVARLRSRLSSLEDKRSALTSLRGKYPRDPEVQRLSNAAMSVDDPRSEQWSELSNYVKETYRISRRMIRNRRNTDATVAFMVSGREIQRAPVESPGRPAITRFLDRLCRDGLGLPADVLFRVFEAGIAGVEALTGHIEGLLAHHAGLPDLASEEFRSLLARLRLLDDQVRVDATVTLVAPLLASNSRVVVATSYPHVARILADSLRRRHGQNSVKTHFDGDGTMEQDQEVWDFLQSPAGSVLVCDRSLDEGRNLQGAVAIVNMDLPLDANRLEQRLGRVDRHSLHDPPARCVVFDEADPWVSGQLGFLADGLRIFEQSVAGIQLSITELTQEVRSRIPSLGSDAFGYDLMALRQRLSFDREQSDYLEELEASQATDGFDAEDFDALKSGDASEDEILGALKTVTGDPVFGLPLRMHRTDHHGTPCFEFRASASASSRPGDTKSLERLVEGRKYTANRSLAAGTDGVALLRPGEPVIDWIGERLTLDAKGRTYGLIRGTSRVDEPTLFLLTDFLTRCSTRFPGDWVESDRRRLVRRVVALFPPVSMRIVTGAWGTVSDELKELVGQPFGRSDEPLDQSSLPIVAETFSRWSTDLGACARDARQEFDQLSDVQSAKERAIERLRRQSASRVAVLRSRAARLPGESERAEAIAEVSLEQSLERQLEEAILNPRTSVMSAGVVILWPSGAARDG